MDYNIEAREYFIGETKVIYDTEDNRVRLLFSGKPSSETIASLKSRGFKWSPRNNAWQRQLTPNAIRALVYLFPESRDAIEKATGGAVMEAKHTEGPWREADAALAKATGA